MNGQFQVSITMADIARRFSSYRQEHGESNGPDINLTFQIKMGLDSLINQYSIPLHDSQTFNRSFIELIEKGRNNSGSFIYDSIIYNKYKKLMMKYLNRMPESTLQAGPGGSLGCEVLLSMAGVKRAYTIDAFPQLTFSLDNFLRALKAYLDLTECLEGLHDYKPGSLKFGEYEAVSDCHYRSNDREIRHFFPRGLENTGFEDNSIEFLFSHATFEHVREPLRCISEIKRILIPGGVTAHAIDLRDHRDFESPLEFLKETDESWDKLMEDYCHAVPGGYMNRWRASDYKRALENEGFEILEFTPERKANQAVIEAVSPFLIGRYRQLPMEDLMKLTVLIVARKK